MDISFVCRNRTYGNYSPVLNGHIAQDLLSSAVLLHETDACPALRQNKRDREEEKESFFKGLHSGENRILNSIYRRKGEAGQIDGTRLRRSLNYLGKDREIEKELQHIRDDKHSR